MKNQLLGLQETKKLIQMMTSWWATQQKALLKALKDAGGIPIILPIGDQEMACHYISMIDKLILTGGQNVDPKFYGEPKTIDSDDYHLQRDIFELALIKEAIKQKKPIFSVCRGTQLFNVAMGGTLYQDIEDHWQDCSAEYTTTTLGDRTRYCSPRNLWRNFPYQLLPPPELIKD